MKSILDDDQDNLELKAFILPGEPDNQQIILMHKKIDKDHYVFTHGLKETDKLRCFRLSPAEKEGSFQTFEYNNPHDIAEVARLMGVDKTEDLPPNDLGNYDKGNK